MTLTAAGGFPFLHIAGGYGEESFSGRPGIFVGSHPEHCETVMKISNLGGEATVELGNDADAGGRLVLRDRNGAVIHEAPLTPR